MTPTPSGSGGKVLTAFLAGAMFGAFAMIEFAPAGSAPASGAQQQVVLAPGDEPLGEYYEENLYTESGEIDPSFESWTDEGLALGDGDAGAAPGSSAADGGGAAGGGPAADAGTTGGGGTTSGAGTTSGGSSTGSGGTAGSTGSGGGGQTGGRTGSGSVNVGGGSTGGGGQTGSGSAGGGGAGGSCSGGATDTGVTANQIKVAATVVNDGPGASLLQPASVGMQAVLNKVNREGGVCGRRIQLETRNDGWNAATGRQYLNRFIDDGNFALLVVPSSEGLAEAIQAGDISRAQIPVVGTTGLRRHEYSDPWVFPVATATVSIMRIMAKHAYDNGARTFGIVYDSKYRFGLEGKDAFVEYVQSLSGASVKAVQPLDPDVQSYGTQAQRFNADCGNTGSEPGCDNVVLLLVPETALKWANANSGTVAGRGKTTYGAQTLFTGAFANSCRGWCNQMVVWTGYVPPIAPVDSAPGVRQYVSDVKAVSASVDTTNQFLEGAYLGTQVFVDAVRRCSPNVTRVCIRDTLNTNTFKSDLVSELSWGAQQRHANRTAQAFRIEATGGSFNGWQYMRTGWIRDPRL